MNNLNIDKDTATYLWVIFIGLTGGLLNVGERKDKSVSRKITTLATGTFSSMFLGWIAYETAFYFTHSEKFGLAVCGFFAWKGAMWVNELVDKVIDSKLKRRDEDWYEYKRYDEIPMPRNLDEDQIKSEQ